MINWTFFFMKAKKTIISEIVYTYIITKDQKPKVITLLQICVNDIINLIDSSVTKYTDRTL